MKRVLLIMTLCLLAWIPSLGQTSNRPRQVPIWEQTGLQIDSLFSWEFVPAAKITVSVVSGKKLKPYNLDYFRSVRFLATEAEKDKVISWIESDARRAEDKEMESEGGKLTYALLCFPAGNSRNRYIGYQVKAAVEGDYVTVVYLSGKATAQDLRVIFKHR